MAHHWPGAANTARLRLATTDELHHGHGMEEFFSCPVSVFAFHWPLAVAAVVVLVPDGRFQSRASNAAAAGVVLASQTRGQENGRTRQVLRLCSTSEREPLERARAARTQFSNDAILMPDHAASLVRFVGLGHSLVCSSAAGPFCCCC